MRHMLAMRRASGMVANSRAARIGPVMLPMPPVTTAITSMDDWVPVNRLGWMKPR